MTRPLRTSRRRAFLALAAAPALAGAAPAYPARPVTLVVPWPPGGTNDLLARLVADPMGGFLGRRVVVDNRAGASGVTGSGAVARAEPDGHTLLWGSLATHVLGPALNAAAPYDPVADFAPVSLLTLTPLVLLLNPSFPARDVGGLLAALRAAPPGGHAYASAGAGTPAHLAGELLWRAAGVEVTHVPYGGSGPALADVAGGHVPVMFDLLPAAVPHVRSGRLRALAVTSARRPPALPDAPTLAEAGFPGLEVSAWNGLFAPAGTPDAVVARLHAAALAALADEGLRARLRDLGADPVGSGPAELAARVRDELAVWAPVLRVAGTAPD